MGSRCWYLNKYKTEQKWIVCHFLDVFMHYIGRTRTGKYIGTLFVLLSLMYMSIYSIFCIKTSWRFHCILFDLPVCLIISEWCCFSTIEQKNAKFCNISSKQFSIQIISCVYNSAWQGLNQIFDKNCINVFIQIQITALDFFKIFINIRKRFI
jgi:hypothetical protein